MTDVFVSVGGGGLLSGVLTAVKGTAPQARVWAVETDGADVLARSLEAGEQIRMTPTSRAKTLGSPYAAQTAIDLADQLAAPPIVVSDEDAFRSMVTIMERTKVVPELAASCTLAAAGTVADRFGPDERVVLLLCGGNVSVDDIAQMREAYATA